MLLVDDVQFLERKTAPRRSSSTPSTRSTTPGARSCSAPTDRPRDLQALEDRLRERFESGLVADIQPPDRATRMAILRKRAQHDRIELGDDAALELIAERVRDNVRALEGALIRVVAFSSLTGRPLTAELAREVLDGLYPSTQPPGCTGSPRSARSRRQPASTSVSPPRSSCPHRAQSRIAWPRQVAMYLTRELTDESLPAIGRQFGGRDHTTVLHACRRASARIADGQLSRELWRTCASELKQDSC